MIPAPLTLFDHWPGRIRALFSALPLRGLRTKRRRSLRFTYVDSCGRDPALLELDPRRRCLLQHAARLIKNVRANTLHPSSRSKHVAEANS